MTERQEMTMEYIIGLMEREARTTKRAALKVENVMHNEHMQAISIVNKKRTTGALFTLIPYDRGTIGMSLSINGLTIWGDAITAADSKSVDYERVIQGLVMTLIYQEVKRDEEMLQKSDR